MRSWEVIWFISTSSSTTCHDAFKASLLWHKPNRLQDFLQQLWHRHLDDLFYDLRHESINNSVGAQAFTLACFHNFIDLRHKENPPRWARQGAPRRTKNVPVASGFRPGGWPGICWGFCESARDLSGDLFVSGCAEKNLSTNLQCVRAMLCSFSHIFLGNKLCPDLSRGRSLGRGTYEKSLWVCGIVRRMFWEICGGVWVAPSFHREVWLLLRRRLALPPSAARFACGCALGLATQDHEPRCAYDGAGSRPWRVVGSAEQFQLQCRPKHGLMTSRDI